MHKKIFAILIFSIFIFSFTAKAEFDTELEEDIDIGQENSSSYDKLQNLINNDETNEQSWTYRPQGKLICGINQETKIKFKQSTIRENYQVLLTKMKFSSNDIVAGTSFFILRIPIDNSTIRDDIIDDISVLIFEVSEEKSNLSAYEIAWLDYPDVLLRYATELNPIDIDSYSENGNNFYVIDDRIYCYVRASVEAEKTYLIGCNVSVESNENLICYITQDDICSDDIKSNCMFSFELDEFGDMQYTSRNITRSEFAWSFLILDSLTKDNFATYHQTFLAGECIEFRYLLPATYTNKTNVYQNFVIPFRLANSSDSKTYNISVKNRYLTGAYSDLEYFQQVQSTDFIIFSSVQVDTGNYVEINIKFLTQTSITFFQEIYDNSTSDSRFMFFERQNSLTNIVHLSYFQLFFSYNQSATHKLGLINYTKTDSMPVQLTAAKSQSTTIWNKFKNLVFDDHGIGTPWDLIAGAFSSTKESAKDFFEAQITKKITDAFEEIKKMTKAIFKDLMDEFSSSVDFLEKIGNKIVEVIKTILTTVVYCFTFLLGIFMIFAIVSEFIFLVGIPAFIIYIEYMIVTNQTKELLDNVRTVIGLYKFARQVVI